MTHAKTAPDMPSSPYALPPEMIQVWRVRLDQSPTSCARLEQLLSPGEMDRAGRFHFERDRRRFIIARGALRMILSGYLGVAPTVIAFEYGPQGKPFLGVTASGIRFNVTHSQELALVAVARDRELGVDVEHVRPFTWKEQTPEHFFSPREVEAFRSLPDDLQQSAFFACWTRKEAYIKARGGGLSIPLECFDVSVVPGEPAALLAVRDDPMEPSRWGMAELQPAQGYMGALVARGKDWHWGYCDWPGSRGIEDH
jgi:4'-phosphopantetheinyl transferase